MTIEYSCNECPPTMNPLVETAELDQGTVDEILTPATLGLNKHLADTGHTSYSVRTARSIIQITVRSRLVGIWAMGFFGSNIISNN